MVKTAPTTHKRAARFNPGENMCSCCKIFLPKEERGRCTIRQHPEDQRPYHIAFLKGEHEGGAGHNPEGACQRLLQDKTGGAKSRLCDKCRPVRRTHAYMRAQIIPDISKRRRTADAYLQGSMLSPLPSVLALLSPSPFTATNAPAPLPPPQQQQADLQPARVSSSALTMVTHTMAQQTASASYDPPFHHMAPLQVGHALTQPSPSPVTPLAGPIPMGCGPLPTSLNAMLATMSPSVLGSQISTPIPMAMAFSMGAPVRIGAAQPVLHTRRWW